MVSDNVRPPLGLLDDVSPKNVWDVVLDVEMPNEWLIASIPGK